MMLNYIESITKTRSAKIAALLTAFLVLVAIWIAIINTSYQRIGVFGCFDQCFNFVAAYFMLKGKTLFSQIFFNHQPLMAYLSYLIQLILQPNNLYQLVLFHRLFILAFSLLMNLLFIFRFRWVGLGFVLFYETTKFYLFGNFFLPEAIIVYPLGYLIGLLWESFQKKKLTLFDYVASGVFTWLIIFLRVPYIPLAVVLYALLFISAKRKDFKPILVSLLTFFIFSFILLANLPFQDYLYDVFFVNLKAVTIEAEAIGIKGVSFLKIFVYPLLILFGGKVNHFRIVLVGLDIIFLSSIAWLIKKRKKRKEILLILFILGLAAIRYVDPGTVFYEAFHLLTWYSLFLMITFLLLREVFHYQKTRRVGFVLTFFLVILFLYTVLSPQSFIWEKVNRDEEFTVNYAHFFAIGEVIKILSTPQNALFLDLWDDLIYWQSGLDSSYQYSLYTPIMTNFKKFKEARLAMFRYQPPDFYYAYYGMGENCPPLFPDDMTGDYAQLYFGEKPSCLYIRKENLIEITANQWEEVEKLGFYLPETKKQIPAY